MAHHNYQLLLHFDIEMDLALSGFEKQFEWVEDLNKCDWTGKPFFFSGFQHEHHKKGKAMNSQFSSVTHDVTPLKVNDRPECRSLNRNTQILPQCSAELFR